MSNPEYKGKDLIDIFIEESQDKKNEIFGKSIEKHHFMKHVQLPHIKVDYFQKQIFRDFNKSSFAKYVK